MGAAFVAEDLTKVYKKNIRALDGLSLEVAEGELFGLLGPNGAGKSTLVKIGCGLVHPTRGRAEVCGVPSGSRVANAKLGYLAELFRFPGWLTADEVLTMHQRMSDSEGGASERAELLELIDLRDATHRRVETMSKGMQQRLGIAQALVGSPRLLILDEPTSALDPAGRRIIRALLEELKGRGVSVLLNSHLLSEVELVCDRVAIILAGCIVSEGTPDSLRAGSGVEVETDRGVKHFPGALREETPGIVARLLAEGAQIYEVRTTRRSLEDVYLEAVQGQTG